MTDLKFILLCFTLMVSACGHNRKTVDAVPNTDFEPIGINLPLRQNVSDSLMTSVMGTDYFFVVDADCSLCLSVLFKELDYINLDEVSRFIIAAPIGSEPTIRYYIRQTYPDILDRVTILDGKRVLNVPLDEFSGNFYKIVDGSCVGGE